MLRRQHVELKPRRKLRQRIVVLSDVHGAETENVKDKAADYAEGSHLQNFFGILHCDCDLLIGVNQGQ